MSQGTLIVIAGPTASGKTAFAIRMAKALKTVIVSADSRQFYKEMQIGTAAPTIEEKHEVKHYNIHNISIQEKYSVADYEKEVVSLLDHLFVDHETVIMTGGSGLFIDAVCNGIDPMPDIKTETRRQVEQQYSEGGLTALQQALQNLDPEYYSIVDTQNPRRLKRALEICYQTGKTFSSFRKRQSQPRSFNVIKLALLWDRSVLYERINKRVDVMMEEGLLEEARRLYPMRNLNALNTVGYKELFAYFDGIYSLEEAVAKIKENTRHYAKRQMTWFRKDPKYHWIHPDAFEDALAYVLSNI